MGDDLKGSIGGLDIWKAGVITSLLGMAWSGGSRLAQLSSRITALEAASMSQEARYNGLSSMFAVDAQQTARIDALTGRVNRLDGERGE